MLDLKKVCLTDDDNFKIDNFICMQHKKPAYKSGFGFFPSNFTAKIHFKYKNFEYTAFACKIFALKIDYKFDYYIDVAEGFYKSHYQLITTNEPKKAVKEEVIDSLWGFLNKNAKNIIDEWVKDQPTF